MMDETVNNIRGENRKPDMKTLIFADDVLMCGKDKNTDVKLVQLQLLGMSQSFTLNSSHKNQRT
jgi:hypothetical protein